MINTLNPGRPWRPQRVEFKQRSTLLQFTIFFIKLLQSPFEPELSFASIFLCLLAQAPYQSHDPTFILSQNLSWADTFHSAAFQTFIMVSIVMLNSHIIECLLIFNIHRTHLHSVDWHQIMLLCTKLNYHHITCMQVARRQCLMI